MKDFVFHKIEKVAEDSLTVKTAEVTPRVSETRIWSEPAERSGDGALLDRYRLSAISY
jgi:hypothetical protein